MHNILIAYWCWDVEEVSIKNILENPKEWEGKEVVIVAEYLGWGKGNCDLTKSSLRTRSDITLKQEDYCIFCDPIEGLKPWEGGRKIRIKATVEIFVELPRLSNPELLEIIG